MKLSNLMFLLLIISPWAFAKPNLIKIYCPESRDIRAFEEADSWAKYHYIAYTSVDLPELGNRLEMIGQGDSKKATIMQAATWTDRLFLCVYNFGWDVIVIFDSKLDRVVKNCYFNDNPRHSECISSNPQSCPMTCEVA